MKQIDLREGARRQHRAVALFAVVQCWMRGLDGIAFERRHLERLLGLKRFKGTRHDWMEEDFAEFFPHTRTFWRSAKSLHSYFVSRVVLEGYLSVDRMTTSARVRAIVEGGPRIGIFKMWNAPTSADKAGFEGFTPFFRAQGNFDERLLHAYLALLSQGQVPPGSIPTLEYEPTPVPDARQVARGATPRKARPAPEP